MGLFSCEERAFLLHCSGMQAPWHIVTFYKFLPIAKADVNALRDAWYAEGERLGICGLFLVAEEGVNATVAGSKEGIKEFLTFVEQTTCPLTIKTSESEKKPFRRWKVAIREEIVAIGKPSMHPSSEMNRHLTPEEFKNAIETEDVVIIDARNTYETAIGKFKNAFDPKTKTFQEFPNAVKNANLPKDKKILMYCTGGIRCEKALMEMQEQGYEHVYQLQGGILSYLEAFPPPHFELEEPVLRGRVALGEEEIVLGGRIDVVDAPPVADDLDRALEARYAQARRVGLGADGPRGDRERGDRERGDRERREETGELA